MYIIWFYSASWRTSKSFSIWPESGLKRRSPGSKKHKFIRSPPAKIRTRRTPFWNSSVLAEQLQVKIHEQKFEEMEWSSGCSSMYPHPPPCWGVGGTCWKCLHLPPTPTWTKNVTKIFYTKYFFYTIKYLKCLFNSIIYKSNFINGEIQWRKAKETERGRLEVTRWREGRWGMKGMEK